MENEPVKSKFSVDGNYGDVMIVGGGISGIQAALDLATAGFKVYLVEKSPTIGGHMAQLDKTFPTLDCSACILTPKMVAVQAHPNITLMTWSEVTQVEGYVGFAMTETGLREVRNPSAIFLSRTDAPAPGSLISVLWEGTRPLLVEVQSLVVDSQYGTSRRLGLGMDQNRLAMLLAVLTKHGGMVVADQDVFVNVVGGIKISETSADLAVVLAVVSSFRNISLSHHLFAFGEIGLSGEIRPVPNGEARIKEAAKHGFRKAVVPRANVPKRGIDGIEIVGVCQLAEALEALF